jgi:hypothetical protein
MREKCESSGPSIGHGDTALRENHHWPARFQQRDHAFYRQRTGGIDHQVIDKREQNLKM